jgi:hypothetical protein
MLKMDASECESKAADVAIFGKPNLGGRANLNSNLKWNSEYKSNICPHFSIEIIKLSLNVELATFCDFDHGDLQYWAGKVGAECVASCACPSIVSFEAESSALLRKEGGKAARGPRERRTNAARA